MSSAAYDAIVVGARCAGSPVAMLRARAGFRVLLLDRATFPSDTVSTHAITGDGSERLQRWGLLDAVLATGCPPVHSVSFGLEGQTYSFSPPLMNLCPRRFAIDTVLVEAAAAAGVEVRQGCSFQRLLADDGRVTGVRYRAADGELIDAHCQVVV
ncbi:MAG: NAD(P)/FAD-dependent oxidoreductase, partial [Tepidiformaceae bacterium]